ncbi:MAG TPA: hypothetical protein VKA64_00400, partial [Gammaproteobacteria bacterium]|nr:hypothetical protein [Gammaproteobacteria bacterium]
LHLGFASVGEIEEMARGITAGNHPTVFLGFDLDPNTRIPVRVPSDIHRQTPVFHHGEGAAGASGLCIWSQPRFY